MNESESSNSLDLRLLPSWLKEENSAPDYSNHQGGEDRPRRDRPDQRGNQRGSRPPGGRPSGGGPGGPAGPGGPRRDFGGPRPQNRPPGPGGPGGQGRPGGKPGDRPQRPGGQGGRSGPGNQGDRRDQRGPRPDFRPERAPEPPVVSVQFFPEEIALGKVTEQILASAAAYPVFGVARMFLQRPERHLVKLTALEGQMLYKLNGTNILSSDRSRLEAIAFQSTRDQWFKVEVVETGEIKGNFTSVAKSRLTGKIFGPTNHHTFQSAIRREYDERFSRRMSFPEYRATIENSSDPALVEQWKQEASRTEKYVTLQAEPEQTFASEMEAGLYFRKEILPGLIVESGAETLPGPDARDLRENRIANAIRSAWDQESKYPLGMVNEIRNHLQNSGLHIFKYKKRVLLVSTIRPVWLDDKTQNLSESIRSILTMVREKPGISRKDLVAGLLGPVEGELTAEQQARKTVLAGDLYWLVRQGHVIEFADGTLDLPLSPRNPEGDKPEKPEQKEKSAAKDSQPESPKPETVVPPKAGEVIEAVEMPAIETEDAIIDAVAAASEEPVVVEEPVKAIEVPAVETEDAIVDAEAVVAEEKPPIASEELKQVQQAQQ